MSEEIKEKLDLFPENMNNIAKEAYYQLEDYITNLQQQLHQASLDIQELTERDLECPTSCEKLKDLQQENEDLRLQLKGTTHCYDEEEHKRLQQENGSLKEDRKYLLNANSDLKKENERLNKQLEYLRSGEYLNQVKWERDLNENLNQTLGNELEDYNSRVKEAINLILNWYPALTQSESDFKDDLLNILQGKSDE